MQPGLKICHPIIWNCVAKAGMGRNCGAKKSNKIGLSAQADRAWDASRTSDRCSIRLSYGTVQVAPLRDANRPLTQPRGRRVPVINRIRWRGRCGSLLICRRLRYQKRFDQRPTKPGKKPWTPRRRNVRAANIRSARLSPRARPSRSIRSPAARIWSPS